MKHPQTSLLLIGESFSPWTKKARWALEHCGLAYAYKEYTPTLSEPGLRWRLRQWMGRVSVPVLFADRRILRGSWEIAQFANESAGGAALGDMSAVAVWQDLSEAALAEGRTAVVRRILGNDKAIEEGLPAFVPEPFRPLLRFLARDAIARLDRKYAHLANAGALRDALIRTRDTLAQTESDYLLGDFSYADMAMAVVLEVIAPVARHEPPLGSATQRCWNDQALSDEFKDLLAWRDRLAASDKTSYSQFRAVS